MSPRYRSHRRSVLALAPARMVECRGRKRYRKVNCHVATRRRLEQSGTKLPPSRPRGPRLAQPPCHRGAPSRNAATSVRPGAPARRRYDSRARSLNYWLPPAPKDFSFDISLHEAFQHYRGTLTVNWEFNAERIKDVEGRRTEVLRAV